MLDLSHVKGGRKILYKCIRKEQRLTTIVLYIYFFAGKEE